MRKITNIFTISATAIILIYDVVAMCVGGSESTISAFIIENSTKNPVIPFLFGVLMWHWFGPVIDKKIKNKN